MASADLSGKTLVLYDGVCGLCNAVVRFLLRFDKHDRFCYAALQSEFAAAVLRHHGLDPKELSSVVLVKGFGQADQRALTKFDGVLEAARTLGGIWRLTRVAAVLPRRMRNWIYDVIARNRYRYFGKYETCAIPTLEQRVKFVDHTIKNS